jgi:predicted ATP-dependent endonuclease of OLD family
MQRIIVKNFGPLVDIDLEIKDFMVFIGPNASGKSTLTKLIYFFNAIPELMEKSLVENFTAINSGIVHGLNAIFWNFHSFSLSPQFNQDTLIKFYFSEKIFIELVYSPESTINFEPIFNGDLIETFGQIETLRDYFLSKLPNNFIDNNVASKEFLDVRYNFKFEISKIFTGKFFNNIESDKVYIPEGRSIASESYDQNSYIKKNYLDYLADTKYFFSKNLEKGFDDQITNEILKGKPLKTGENNYGLMLENKNIVPFNLISSGQKESFWLVLILKNLQQKIKAKQIIIEEPETHLFPDSQKTLIELITLIANQKNNKVIITTHSHYILGAINILINAFRIGQLHAEKVEKVIPKNLWLDKDKILIAYLRNGKLEDIYSESAEMFDHDVLTKTSAELNSNFDKLMEIEFEDA